MTSTRHNGRSPISMVSFLSCECSDQAEASEGMRVPEYPMRVGLKSAFSGAPVWLHIKPSSSAKADDPVLRGLSSHRRAAVYWIPRWSLSSGSPKGETRWYDSRSPACFPALLASNKD